MTELTRSEQVDVSQVRLWARFRATARKRLAQLEALVEAALLGTAISGTAGQAQRDARRLADALAAFGFPEAAGMARDVESLLDDWMEGAVTSSEAAALALQLVRLRNELQRGPSGSTLAVLRARRKRSKSLPRPVPAAASRGPGSSVSSPLMLVVARPSESLDEICVAATTRGFRISQVQEAPLSAEPLARLQPDVILLEMAEPDGREKLRALALLAPSIPVIGLLMRGDLEERFLTLEAGATAVLDLANEPVPVAELADRLWSALWHRSTDRARILVVDDDAGRLARYREILETGGYRVSTLDDPRQVVVAMRELAPDLVILEVAMAGAGGLELCRVLRTDPQWAGLPIVLAGAHDDAPTIARVFAARADDYVARSVSAPDLLVRVANRLERVMTLRRVARRDSRTGLRDLPTGMGALEQLLHLARRHRQPLCLGIVEPDGLAALRSLRGDSAADAVLERLARFLERALQDEDVLYRGEGETLVTGYYGLTRDDGQERLAQVLEHFRGETFTDPQGEPFRATFWASVASFAADGGSVAALLERARSGLARAPGECNRVVSAAARAEQTQAGWTCDILLVEPDRGLADLVTESLRTRGYRVQHAGDGRAALELLCGGEPRVKTRMILLDASEPEQEADLVLDRLAAGDIAKETRILVATSRSTPETALRSTERGAFDSIVKPFGVDLLLTRVRRALGS